MNSTLTRIQLERERLRARCDSQRRAVEQHVAGLAVPIALLDGACRVGRSLRAHPALAIGAAAALLALRSRSILGLLARGAGWWRLARTVRSALNHFGS